MTGKTRRAASGICQPTELPGRCCPALLLLVTTRPRMPTHQVWQGTLMTVQPQARSRRRRIMVCPSGELVLTAKWKGPSTSMAILRSVGASEGSTGGKDLELRASLHVPRPAPRLMAEIHSQQSTCPHSSHATLAHQPNITAHYRPPRSSPPVMMAMSTLSRLCSVLYSTSNATPSCASAALTSRWKADSLTACGRAGWGEG